MIKPENPDTIADGLRTALGDKTFPIIRDLVDDIVLVTEEEIVTAMRTIFERMKIIVEPSSAVPLAGLLAQKVNVKDKKTGIILSGGNVDFNRFFEALDK
jgi:threonine dehydratase